MKPRQPCVRRETFRQLARRGSLSRIEALESRTMLAADLLVSVFDDTGGLSVLRYDENLNPVAGGVPTSMTVAAVQGLAVAPDGTFFISSLASGQVLHYDNGGNLLGALGAGDAVPAPLIAPSTLVFGPNGHLYVGDLQSASIFEFDTSSPTQQYLQSETLFLGYAPGGFAFEDDGELVVGDLFFQGLNHYDTSDNLTVWIEQGSGIHPAAVLIRPDGDILIGDITLGQDPMAHHQVVLYDVSEDTTSQFINLTTPVGTGESAGFPPQPTALAYDQSGDLLVGLSPDHNLNGAIQRYNPDTGAFIETLVSNIGTPTGIAFLEVPVIDTVVGRHIFYNQSSFDGNNAGIDPVSDNAAIATDKNAYLPNGTTAIFENVTSYSRGINGIMVDLTAGGNHAAITAADFVFKVGNNNTPGSWAAAPAVSGLSVVLGGGVAGSDRVIITWAAGAIKNQWLEVQVLANANTGLATPDVHFWGNKIGDVGISTPATVFQTTTTDSAIVFATQGAGKPVTATSDFNRDGQTTTTDSAIVFANQGTITRINIGPGGPFAPEAEPAVDSDGGSAVALALAISVSEKASVSEPVHTVKAASAVELLPPRDRFFAEIAFALSAEKSLAEGVEIVSVSEDLLDELVDALSF